MAVKEFPLEEIRYYGCIRAEPIDDTLFKVLDDLTAPDTTGVTPRSHAVLTEMKPSRTPWGPTSRSASGN